MNLRPTRAFLPYVAVLAVTALLGGGVMWQLQRSVAIAPGEAGCSRLADPGKRADCLGELLLTDLRSDGVSVQSGLDDIEARAASDEALADSCHQAMHRVGHAIGGDAASAGRSLAFPARSTRLCTAGYTHGLVEGYLAGGAAATKIVPIYEATCRDTKAESGCVHGIGHVVQKSKDTTEAVRLCGQLPTAVQSDCSNGVFMERAMARPAEKPATFARACGSQPTAALRDDCFFYLPASASSNGFDDAATAKLCGGVTGPSGATCFESFGRNLGANRLSACSPANSPAHVESCLTGALELSLSSGHVKPAAARTQCASLDEAMTRTCTGLVERLARS